MTKENKNMVGAKERYIKPSIKVLDIEQEQMLLAGSEQPGPEEPTLFGLFSVDFGRGNGWE